MNKRDFKTYQKHFRDFAILPKFSETHVFRGTIHHPYSYLTNSYFMNCQLESHLPFAINLILYLSNTFL